jgi:hypothetical protein
MVDGAITRIIPGALRRPLFADARLRPRAHGKARP